LIDRHQGRFVNSAGDSVLAEFASVVEAVNCAADIQIWRRLGSNAIGDSKHYLPYTRRRGFAIGIAHRKDRLSELLVSLAIG
jgi:adenylate cyclase